MLLIEDENFFRISSSASFVKFLNANDSAPFSLTYLEKEIRFFRVIQAYLILASKSLNFFFSSFKLKYTFYIAFHAIPEAISSGCNIGFLVTSFVNSNILLSKSMTK